MSNAVLVQLLILSGIALTQSCALVRRPAALQGSEHTTINMGNPTKDTADTSDSRETAGDDYYNKSHVRFENFTYRKSIKTVMLHQQDWPLGTPVIELFSEEKLKLSFDDLAPEQSSYYYTIMHCTAEWEDSEMMPTDYIEGFVENHITAISYSFNTLQNYTHYNLVFPNEDMDIKRSGNYVIKVYVEGNPGEVVLTRRFMVVDSKVSVLPEVRKATLIDDKNYKQEIDFVINYAGYPIADPYSDVFVVITQNGRWDNAVNGLQPVFVRNDELIYDYDEQNVFEGGNEFRNFDFKSFRFKTERIREYGTDSLGRQVHLFDDHPRSFLRYSEHTDINGRFFIKNEEGRNSETDADYALIHFSLPYEAPMTNGNMYLLGGFTQWGFSQESQLKYNYSAYSYQTVMLLKQGYYEYLYVYLQDGKSAGETALIEGSHFYTENEYTIYVYNTSITNKYHQLIAVKNFVSRSR